MAGQPFVLVASDDCGQVMASKTDGRDNWTVRVSSHAGTGFAGELPVNALCASIIPQ
jgi:hypothetical protein